MFFSAIITSIRDRLLADTASGGLNGTGSPISGGVLSIVGSGGVQASPYIVIGFGATSNMSAFRAGRFALMPTITIYYKHNNESDRAWAAVDRIMGDSFIQANHLPTFGLNNWIGDTLTGITGYTVETGGFIMQSIQPGDAISDEQGVIVITFSSSVSYRSS